MNYQHKHNKIPQIGSFDLDYIELKITNHIAYHTGEATKADNLVRMQFSGLIAIEKPTKISH